MTKDFLGKTLGKFGARGRDALAHALINSGVSPNVLTITGVVINIIGGILIAMGAKSSPGIHWLHVLGGVVILIANIFDVLDGTVARLSGRVSKFGAFLDSVTDRYSDMILFSGAITYFALLHDIPFVIVSAAALAGSLMTSYTRARAESLLPGKFNAGYMERPERIVAIVVSCLFSRLYVGMLCIAIFANLATFHRIWDVWHINRNLEYPEQARRGYGSLHSPALIQALRSLTLWTYPRQTWQHDALGVVLFLAMLAAPLR